MSFSLTEFSEIERQRWLMSLSDDELFGKCDDSLELRLPSELKDALARRAAAEGRSVAAQVRFALVMQLFGPEHVAMLIARRYGLAQKVVPIPAPEAVRTTAGAGA